MQTNTHSRTSRLAALFALATTLTLATPTGALAKGGSGGGGGSSTPKVIESRVTGYVTAIDYSAGTISIGASY